MTPIATARPFLADNGVTVDDLAGGMRAWQGVGLPVVASDGRPGRVV